MEYFHRFEYEMPLSWGKELNFQICPHGIKLKGVID